jgi:hypothetical protein
VSQAAGVPACARVSSSKEPGGHPTRKLLLRALITEVEVTVDDEHTTSTTSSGARSLTRWLLGWGSPKRVGVIGDPLTKRPRWRSDDVGHG